jgi:hypothetical protein
MAAWTELTQEQRDVYQAFERDLRSVSGNIQRLMNTLETLNVRYNAQISAILVDLTDNTVVPNASSGLSGSQSLDSDSEMVTLVSHIQGLLTNYNTSGHKELRAKAAGQAINGNV